MSKPTLTIMCGLPRSGKSTWIKRNRKNSVVISPDKIRSEIFGHQFFNNAEDFVWGFTKAMARIVLEQGKDATIDATHINYSSRGMWFKIAEEYGVDLEMVWVKTSLAECIKRNKESEKGQKLPDEVIERMAIYFEDPCYDAKDQGIKIKLIEIPKSKKQAQKTVFSNYYKKEICK